jgi:hypothetical protein
MHGYALSAILNHHVTGEAQWEHGFTHGGSNSKNPFWLLGL